MISAVTRMRSSDASAVRLQDDDASIRLASRSGEWVQLDLTVEVDDGTEHPTSDLRPRDELQRASTLRLDSRVPLDTTTEELLRLTPNDPGRDLALVELACSAGRYNVIPSTGELPATLQGVWQGIWSPAWSADYMSTAMCRTTRSPRSSPPAHRSSSDPSSACSFRTSRTSGRTRGASSAWTERCSQPQEQPRPGEPLLPAYPLQFWVGCGGWMIRMLADAVLATGDRRLVDDDPWRLTEEVLHFYRAITARGPLAPAYSPENTPAGSPTPISVGPAMDIAIIRDLARSVQILAEARGARTPELPTVTASYRVEDGRLAEWTFPGQPDDVAHRHTSQLHGLWYEPDEAFDAPKMREAARWSARRSPGEPRAPARRPATWRWRSGSLSCAWPPPHSATPTPSRSASNGSHASTSRRR